MRDDPDTARREAAHAALLPEDDPRRLAFARRAARSAALADIWQDALEGHRELGERLRGVAAPEGLAERLRALRQERPRPRRRGGGRRLALVAAAAAVVLAIGWLGVRLAPAPGGPKADNAVRSLAMLAALDHASAPELAVRTADPAALSAALAGRSPFELVLRPPTPDAVLDGGRLCRFNDRPIVYTRWRTGSGSLALYQLEGRAFGLGPGLGPVEVQLPAAGSPGSPGARCGVRVWSDDRFAYVVVDPRHRGGG